MLLLQSLHALFQPNHTDGDVTELCQRLDIDQSKQLLLLSVFNDQYLSRKDRIPLNPFDDNELESIINSIRNSFEAEYHPLVFPVGDHIVIILQLIDDKDTEGLQSLIYQCYDTMNKALPFLPFIAVSEPPIDAYGLPAAFSSIQQMIGYKSIMGDLTDDILFSSRHTISGSNGQTSSLVSKQQHEFVFHVRIGQFNLAKVNANELCHKRLVDDSDIQTLAITMASTKDFFIHAIQSACIDFHMLACFSDLNIALRISSATSVLVLMNEVDQILDSLDTAFKSIDSRASLPLRMKAYVDENYVDPNLNVNLIANFFSISPSYAIRIFQREYNQTLLQYIHLRRINRAKEELASGKSIAEIAGITGYGTSVNMIRSFKKYEGLTPGSIIEKQITHPTKTK